MDLKPYLFVLLSFSLVSCGVSYSTSTFINDNDEIGYETTLYTPESDSIYGDFIYLSDSTDKLEEPTPLMLSYLSKNFRVIVPHRWGAPGRSRMTLDNYDNRLRGVSYSLSQIRTQRDTVLPLHILGEGFYSSIAIRLAKDYRTDDLMLVQPMYYPLQQIMIQQVIEEQDTTGYSLNQLWGLSNDSLRNHFVNIIEVRGTTDESMYNVHYTKFIRSYWSDAHIRESISRLSDTIIPTVFHNEYPLYSIQNQKSWEANSNIHLLKWPEKKPWPSYGIHYWETLFLSED
ncbi:hypothetical protein [Phaeocystidibacter marisrubri]|uniref:Uncharacterized protein n=1 Tax=Phaeocystidibacter marisrubri TaxID=1577780 RepID=A0A6L3ZF75_9FLAO|nr:hypothetical protein [Phaeocystidibacter marisrubri]KAB2816501.1 hypothetical protein F8C82_12530 [Phaeocystidibacter marisrubri]GGH69372.1 hypothetical protein GCM10011318_10320 [Phaeocystidibacter marisrubri]